MTAQAVKKNRGSFVWLAGLTGLAVLSGFVVLRILPVIETDIRADVNKTLADKGLTEVEARVSGQQVTLTPKSDRSEAYAQLMQAREAVAGLKKAELPPVKWPTKIQAVADSQWLKGEVTEISVVRPAVSAPSQAMVQGQAIMEGQMAPMSASQTATAVATTEAPSEMVHGERATTIASASETPRVAGDTAFEASTVAAQSCENRVNRAVAGRPITYEFGTYTLTAEAQAVIDDVYKVVSSCPTGTRITVAGYSDNVGDGTVNQLISQARAQATANALIARGLPDERVVVRGYGATAPVADNSTREGREKNRRIVFAVNAG